MSPASLPPGYFEKLYADNSDPWQFETRWYEQRKYALTLAALPRRQYRRALEPGCSNGVLSQQLAGRCDRLVATDVVESALARARERVAGTGVECRNWALGSEWTLGTFDLIVLSEVCYYLDAESLVRAMQAVTANLADGGTLLSVHWRHPVAEYPLSGDAVHAILCATPGLTRVGGYIDPDMRIDVHTTIGSWASVAAEEGLDGADVSADGASRDDQLRNR